ncbi:hypothetical protein [Nocardioides convexus]|uniref:hypothetical protein n=1 Tax=Nocardioides convexus TaxID=2712224 RepID=UPI002418A9E4|nr:hypothetical protein [Nocardioides convexus]
MVRAGAGSARDTLSVLDQAAGRGRAAGRDLRAWPAACWATPRTPCSTTSSPPSPAATARPSSGSSTR